MCATNLSKTERAPQWEVLFFMVVFTQEEWDLRQPLLFKVHMCRMTTWVLELTLGDGLFFSKSLGLPLSTGTALTRQCAHRVELQAAGWV